MNADNPLMQFPERAPYEFGLLMRALPPGTNVPRPLSEDQRHQVSAAASHSSHAIHTLLVGMESLGQVLFVAASNKDWPIELDTVASLAKLIKHIAVETQFLLDTREELEFDLADDDARIAAAGLGPMTRGEA